ncbi:MAG: hypothetical protein ACJ8GN_17280 [Longimicrobiaceae bacterium]
MGSAEMAEELVEGADARRERVFIGAHTDSALQVVGLPQTHDHLRIILNLFALLYEEVVTTDSVFLDNLPLRDLLIGKDRWDLGYDRMLREGVLVAALRDSSTSFRARLEEMREQQLHASFLHGAADAREADERRALQEGWAEFVDSAGRTEARYEGPVLGAGFTEGIEALFRDRTALVSLGLAPIAGTVRKRLDELRKETGGLILRTHLWEVAKTQDREAAQAIYRAASVIYHRNAAWHLGLDPALPTQLKGADLSAWLEDVDSATRPLRWNVEHEEEIHPALSPSVLSRVPYDVIAHIRGTSAFAAYIDETRKASALADLDQAEAVRRYALREYVAAIEEELALASRGRYWQHRDAVERRKLVKAVSTLGDVVLMIANGPFFGTTVQLVLWPIELAWYFGHRWLERRLGRREDDTMREARNALHEANVRGALPGGEE